MNLFHREKHRDGVEYQVKIDGFGGGEYDLIFDTRDGARGYKSSIKQSKSRLQGHIIKRVYDSGFILSENEVY